MEGEVPAEDAGGAEEFQHPDVLQNETPWAVGAAFDSGVVFLQSYGWFLLLGVAALMFIKSRLQPQIDNYRKKKEEQSYLDMDPNVARSRQEAMEASRRKLQEMHDANAARHAEIQKQKEEEKRRERIEDWERHQRGGGYRSKYKPQEEKPEVSTSSGSQSKPKPKTTYRSNDYNPLTGGGGGGACFRPNRSSRGGGG